MNKPCRKMWLERDIIDACCLHNLENIRILEVARGKADGPCAWTYIAYEPLARPLDDATRNKYSNQLHLL